MKKISLILGTSNSQPVGSRNEDLEYVYQNAYKPYLQVLYHAPAVPLTLHYSGTLLDWLDRHHSEFTDVLSEMVGRKQVELLGGGFHTPVFSLIPRVDRIGQVEGLTTHIRKRFGKRPRGAWITEHVWEPSLAYTLKNSGMEYIFLDDYHFHTAGFEGSDFYRPCLTEDQGKTIVVFPVCRSLRNLYLNRPPGELIEHLRSLADDGERRVVSLMVEGERLLDIADESTELHREGWLTDFVELLVENSEWIDMIHPSRYLREEVPRTRGYFPPTAYYRMRSWNNGAADPGTAEGFEYFRQFLTRYVESNMMYAKMQYTHVLVNQIRGDKYRKQAAREELWRGQCHVAYWHGKSAGIYNSRLRKRVYSCLIEAEKVTRERGIFIPSILTVDFDMDGLSEYLFQGQDLNAYVHLVGGRLFELDYLPKAWNYLDTFARYREEYHPEGDEESRGYDTYPRDAFMDHFLAGNETLERYASGQFTDVGGFLNTVYTVEECRRDQHELILSAEGLIRLEDGVETPMTLRKRYKFRRSAMTVYYTITNSGHRPVATTFAPEINVSPLSDIVSDLQVYVRPGRGKRVEVGPDPTELEGATEVLLEDSITNLAVTLSFQSKCDMWSAPIRTQSLAHGEMVTTYQGSSFLPRWYVELEPGDQWENRIVIRLEKL